MPEPEIFTTLKGVPMKGLIEGSMRLIYDCVVAAFQLSGANGPVITS